MTRDKAELTSLFRPAEFPQSAKYEPEWVIENMMGPNPLWLTESLCGDWPYRVKTARSPSCHPER